MLNQIFWKKVQGQKHPGRWDIAEPQIPSVKMLFKINAKGHKHPSIRLFIIEQDTIGKPKKTKSGIQHGNRALPKSQSYRLWWGAASPILNNTPCVCIYTSYNRTCLKNAYLYIYILTQSFWMGTKVIRRKHITQPTGFSAYCSTCCW